MLKTYLCCPPPSSSVDVRIDLDGLVFICIVSLRCKLHRGCEFGPPKQVLDTGEDIAVIHIERFPGNDHLLSFEFSSTGQMVDQTVEFAWGLV